VNAIDYEVPDQVLDLETEELPPMPKSRFIMRNVRRRQ
jgi:fatty-acid peroxygenase